MKKILCPIRESMINAPGHQVYGITFFDKISKGNVEQLVYAFKQTNYNRSITLWLNLKLTWKALTIKHDALYYGIDPQNLLLLSFLKRLHMYNKPMYAWKYTVIKKKPSWWKNLIIKWHYNAFNKIFMITENHVNESYSEGLINKGKLVYMHWGEDLEYIDKIKIDKRKEFTFISTGKAYRDYETVVKAMSNVSNARLKLYVAPDWGGMSVDTNSLMKMSSGNIDFVVIHDLIPYRDIYIDMLRSHCSLCICKPVNFGVGYTQVLDSLACGLPCILTYNKDNPIDVDKEGVGVTVPPMDINSLTKAMQKMVDDKDLVEKMSIEAKKFVEREYNIEKTAEEVLNYILEEMKL